MALKLEGLNKLKSEHISYEYFSEETGENRPHINSDFYTLNWILTGDLFCNIKAGKWLGLASYPHVGKTFISLHLARQAQLQGYTPIIIDTEGAVDEDTISTIGLEIGDGSGAVVQIDTIEDLKIVFDTIKKDNSEEKLFFILDSLGNIGDEKESKVGALKGDQGQRAKKTKAVLRPIYHTCKRKGWSWIITTHMYDSPDIFSKPEAVGGNHFKHVCHYIVYLKGKLGDTGNYTNVTAITTKTRDTRAFQQGDFVIDFDHDNYNCYPGLVEMATAVGIIEPDGRKFVIQGNTKKYWESELISMGSEIFTQELLEELNTKLKEMNYRKTIKHKKKD